MKRSFFHFTPLLLLLTLASHQPKYDVVRKQPKLSLETPPGCVWLRGNLFIDKMEVRNLDYLECLFWLSRNDTATYRKMLPDTSSWPDSPETNGYKEYYLRHPGYRDYPAVGISYEQAKLFCEWRSKMVNIFLYVRDHKLPKGARWDTISHEPEIMRFRLPTKEEWEYAAAAGLDYQEYPNGYEKLTDEKNLPVSNTLEYHTLFVANEKETRYAGQCLYTVGFPLPVPEVVMFGKPNKYGLYNMTGNVSELIDGGMFKGLNYTAALDGSTLKLKPEDYVVVDSTENAYDYKYTFDYQKPQPWLGFRCVCEVKAQGSEKK